MLFFAVAHSYAFSAREYWMEGGAGAPGGSVGSGGPPRSVWANVSTVFDWSDVGANMVGQVHFGATELVDGMQSAGSAVLGGAAWPFQQLRRQLTKARDSGADTGSRDGGGGVAVTPSTQRRREASTALLLPSGGAG
jgi:hypothetical protein